MRTKAGIVFQVILLIPYFLLNIVAIIYFAVAGFLIMPFYPKRFPYGIAKRWRLNQWRIMVRDRWDRNVLGN